MTYWEWGSDELRLHFLREPLRLAALTLPGETPHEGVARCALPLVELELAGHGRHGTAGKRHVDGLAAQRLRPVHQQSEVDGAVHRLRFDLEDPVTGARVRVQYEIASGVLRSHAEITAGAQPVVVEHLSSFVLSGLGLGRRWEDDLALWRATNPWSGEFRWRRRTLAEEGLYDVGMVAYDQTGSKNRIAATSVGAWPTSEQLPMGVLDDGEHLLAWQVEHNGAWHWELGDRYGAVYLTVSGPTAAEHQWSVRLAPGESFTGVPAAVTLVSAEDGLDRVGAALTTHRRRIRRRHPDHVALPIVYNDFLNALMSDPTTERMLPLIDAAAAAGAEIYCADAGWYDDEDGGWWDAVGEWEPSARRFPGGGLDAVIEHIRAAGLRPGLWLEPEVVGVRSRIAHALPDEAFFRRGGERVQEWGRYQLDLTHPAARSHVDDVVDRLMKRFDLAYLKFDYNIDIGAGTDTRGSAGHGLLEHNRAYLEWVTGVLDRYPGLVIEGCAAGGSRTDGATGAVFPLQSLTDQQDFRRMPAIVAPAPLAIPPEQAGIWSSVDGSMNHEEIAFAMLLSLLGRVHLAGRIDTLDGEQLAVVRDALGLYRKLRPLIPASTPTWPLGLPGWRDDWVAAGLRTGHEVLLAVWRRGGPDTVRIPLAAEAAEVLYPQWGGETVQPGTDGFALTLPDAPSARLLRLRLPR